MCEFVNFSIAKKLKEKGFDKYCCRAYSEIGCFNDTDTYKSSEEFYCYAPTISQVLKWLREKGIFISIYYDCKFKIWLYGILIMENGKFELKDEKTYKTYELASLAGIEYIIDNNLI